jgi:hypothetical protein
MTIYKGPSRQEADIFGEIAPEVERGSRFGLRRERERCNHATIRRVLPEAGL